MRVRGHKSDFDAWADAARDASWGYDHVLNIYRRIENWAGKPDPKYRGVDGPVHVEPSSNPNPLSSAMVKGCASIGIPEFNGPSWSDGIVAGRGWIAVSLVIFAGYRPVAAVLSGLLFGFVTAVGFVGQARAWPIPSLFLSMLPYLCTVALIIVPAIAGRRMRQVMAGPEALGVPYFRDVR